MEEEKAQLQRAANQFAALPAKIGMYSTMMPDLKYADRIRTRERFSPRQDATR